MAHRERIVGRCRLAGGVIDLLEQGKINHPAHLHTAFGDGRAAQLQAQQTKNVGGLAPLVGHEQQQVAFGRTGAFGELHHLGVTEKLGHR